MTLTSIYVTVAVCVMTIAAKPATQRYQSQSPQLLPFRLEYYSDNQGVDNYYNQGHQKQGSYNRGYNGALGRLETLEPDSEVELIPGAHQPQQPPQQNPVSPNIPGLVPGQRVFIVNMPVPGYRPGTIGGYQPVYVVGAAPQGNTYAANGYQNTVFVDPSSGQVVNPLGYRGLQGVSPVGQVGQLGPVGQVGQLGPVGQVGQLGPVGQIGPVGAANPGLYQGSPFAYNRPLDLVYQDPSNYQFPFYEPQGGALNQSPFGYLQGHHPLAASQSGSEAESNPDSKRSGQESENTETKEEETKRNARPASTQQTRNKA